MDITRIKQRIAGIEAMAGDPEAAQAAEGRLMTDVLSAIAAGAENPAALARAALDGAMVSSPRWYA